ncbi:MAG: hypothetical protein ACP5ON_05870 [Bacteroidota bacterium]
MKRRLQPQALTVESAKGGLTVCPRCGNKLEYIRVIDEDTGYFECPVCHYVGFSGSTHGSKQASSSKTNGHS